MVSITKEDHLYVKNCFLHGSLCPVLLKEKTEVGKGSTSEFMGLRQRILRALNKPQNIIGILLTNKQGKD